MFGRPRCREWTPLATQQLRLRSLIQIVGYNIRPPEWCRYQCSFYLTLHHTTMSAPFYTSERISSPHPKWKEIDSEITQTMSSTNVVIRIWCYILHPNDDSNVPQNTVIQTWGVYFSGLRYIGANLASNFTSDCFKSNTLVFQMHGGYFCSYKSLNLDVIPPENELEHGSLSSDSSGRTNLSKILLESRMLTDAKLKGSRSVSPSVYTRKLDKEYSKSHSPVDKGLFHQTFANIRASTSLNISPRDSYRTRDDSAERVKENHIYEHYPNNLDVKEFTDVNGSNPSKNASQEDLANSIIDLSETAEYYDMRNECNVMPKYRYLAINFLKSEIRPSYNASKLQKLHLLQYSIKKRQEAVQEIKEKIYNKSALAYGLSPSEENEFKLRYKSTSQRNLFSPGDDELNNVRSLQSGDGKNGKIKEEAPVSNGPRLTLKLNDLLSYKARPSPFQRAEYVRLTKQIEILRFKMMILTDERDSKLANIRRLKKRHAKLFEENQDVGSELMENYHTLSKRTDSLKETRQSCAALRELAAHSHSSLQNRRCELLNMLHQIFYMEQHDATTWSIIDVPLPICGDENPRNTAARDSVAAGFAAQVASAAAYILQHPLRYHLVLRGSASRVLDLAPDLPDPDIPLFARGGDLTLFRYGLFLLNKCIAQLMWGRGLPVTDIRPTLANLQRLLITPNSMSETSKLYSTYRWVTDSQCPRTQSLRSLVASDRGKYRQFNRFKDSVDGQSPQSVMNLRLHRQSKSVGSYHDDRELPALDQSTTSIMGSESNIYNMKLDQDNERQTLKSHNSDSAILTLTDDTPETNQVTPVNFIIGDDEKLVRISSNNGDELCPLLDDSVKKICSEIEDFCSTSGDEFKNMSGVSIAEYMERRPSDIEDVVNCADCERNKDGDCDIGCAKIVRDVIVIQSAEAILDSESV